VHSLEHPAPGLPAAIAILGPTGSGKSALAMQIAARLPVELISVDSAQVYRGMDIGTAKPSAAERRAIPHHLIDIRDPEQGYSAGEFVADCRTLLQEIAARGHVPLLVGGTMLYYRALFQGIASMPPADPQLRAGIDARAALAGWPALHAELAGVDPVSAARIHPNDAQRIQRALEVIEISGRPLGAHWNAGEEPSSFGDWHICVLQPEQRNLLHSALAARLDSMLAAGFPEEVSNLLARGTLDEQSPAMRLVGYRQLIGYCRGTETLQSAAQHALEATRQLAKRQLTWLRSDSLLPAAATVLRCDPFDRTKMEQMLGVLIKEKLPP
jgi:tRNA dimethylallyltransferase